MTTYASAPGTRLGGRYRLEDRIAAGSGWDAWKAIDETLARAVTVFTFAAGFPRIGEVVTAARAASRLTDPRLAQVFDVEDNWDHAYVVMEWAAGDTLGDMLAQGPLDPYRGARMIAEAAAALSSAHAAGLAHMCLSPGSVRWSPTGEVKVVGLGIDAALSGTQTDEPVLDDTEGLGWLLYAALTGHWPGPEYPPLPPAPIAGGEPCSPRQVVAGIPLVLSDLTCRAMRLSSGPDGSLNTPGEFARALMATLPPTPLPALATTSSWRDQAPRTHDDRTSRDADGDAEDWPSGPGFADTQWPPEGGAYQDLLPPVGHRARSGGPGHRPRVPARFARGIAIGVAVLAVAAVAVFVLRPGGGTPKGRPHAGGSSTPLTAVTLLQPAGAQGFDPLTSASADPSNEETKYAKYAIDSSLKTDWSSQWYASPEFGHLKAGSGLMIDMGRPVKFSMVTVTFNSQPGANVKVLVGNSNERSRQNLDSMTEVQSADSPTGTVSFHINSDATGRYLVIWFTRLPPKPGSNGQYEAQIYNVAIRGTAQTQ